MKSFSIKKVMVALETSSPDRSVLQFLNNWAEQVPIQQLLFVHVVPTQETLPPGFEKELQEEWEGMTFDEEKVRTLEKELEGYFPAREELYLRFALREGDPLEQLLLEIDQEKPDLVLIGQRMEGRHEILARNLVRKSPCHVLVIPERFSHHPMSSILVPVDFSPHSVTALQTALRLGECFLDPPDMTALHVYSMPDFSVYRVSRSPSEYKEMMEKTRQEAFSAFLTQHAGEYSGKLKFALMEKEMPGIAHYIMEKAEELQSHLLVMGAKGHSKVELLLLGSVTEKVLSLNKDIPVLVIKE
jgi:nucleotide-binding universal stress UspA family protein